ncbi:PREDICTED: cytochrome P450 6B6-like isoform X2 [Papilio polytes]|uniref:cytochrome P450 6B6-like isoform X2 n=1 Tax=Papilio polytes TaxID=76194 RepID=UPI0006763014|nr:PREDICTED: cytochrome P450 6B6-like isoform X2 [Papilio polytes]XP_013141722.1 PREDICTED: cytochrome P450 6B6-like isoform X2 [Papilio polytes]
MLAAALILVVLVALYLHGTKTFRYWEKRGIKYEKPVPFIGTYLPVMFRVKSMAQLAVDLYWKYPNKRVVGCYRLMRPELVVRDPVLVKQILVTDFVYFNERGFNTHKTYIEPLSKNLFFIDGDIWKLLRQRMTPAFTSGKIRAMFPLIVERAERLQNNAINVPSTGGVLDAREIMARYTTDFIGAVGFGLDSNSLIEEDSAFRKLGAEIFKFTISQAAKQLLKEFFPETFKNIKIMSKIEDDVFVLVRNILQKRNNKPSGRNDFIDLLLECKERGNMVGDSIEMTNADGTPKEVSIELSEALMVAQVFVFFAAGFETSASSTSYTLHELAYHPEELVKVQQEIDRVLANYNYKLCYDAIYEMNYLQCAFKEGIRIMPSLGYLQRKCARRYTFKDLDLSIDEGVSIVIPLQAMHKDPAYFYDPDSFRPERFQTDFINPMTKQIFLPFGDGPRACIGERLGKMQSLAGLAAVLSRYSVEPAPESLRHPKIDPTSNIVQAVIGGIPLLFRPRTA